MSLQWEAALTAYRAARTAEMAHDIATGIDAWRATPDAPDYIAPEVWAEADRLQDITADAEEALMAIPSPSAGAFAFKYLIAKGDKRGADCWDAMFEAEAKRFAAVPDWPPSQEFSLAYAEWQRLRALADELVEADPSDGGLGEKAFAAAGDQADRAIAAPVSCIQDLEAKARLIISEYACSTKPDWLIEALAADARRLTGAA
ncbi:hypothetical protein KFK14_17565 [Sphingobium phenoxybenzoativorans]|uniref:Uncharacterized protein n=1 Tax=Sphingobium phenoxybenzoativorans TaxID=1592790 RepID=A0A975Q0F9_9SPHN|nr:hypothetical protein [Sphingobium phenoxybenzoativorans]QUT04825.1 hypothetical protein KFK14_17565 [Sphingobium phenoxybenzoativorans]